MDRHFAYLLNRLLLAPDMSMQETPLPPGACLDVREVAPVYTYFAHDAVSCVRP